MAVVIASDLRKEINGEPLLSGISFKLERRDRMTLSGRNGAGKTTLLRMIAGEASIDGGEIVFAKGAKIALHDQRPPRQRDLTLRDYVLSGATELVALETRLRELEQLMADGDYSEQTLGAYADAQAALEHAGGYTWRERALSTLHGLGFNDDSVLDRQLNTFSGGELTRASLGRALAGSPDLLLLDEPTNHLDIASLEWLEAHLVSLDAAVILIAHDRWFLESVGTSVLELEAGRGKFFDGSWTMWRKEKATRELALGRAIERQEAEIARLEQFVTRFRAGTRSRQASSRQKQLDKIERLDRGAKDREGLKFAFKPPERSGRVVFELEHGNVKVGPRTLLHDGELWLERGEHVTVVGPNGSGKTTLIEALAGVQPFADDASQARDATGRAVQSSAQAKAGASGAGAIQTPASGPVVSGSLKVGHNVQVGFLSQHTEELSMGNARTVAEAAQIATGLKPGPVRALLGRFLFSGEEAEKPLEALSGGERRRLTLAIVVQSGANVLILDEPTNHLDIESREALEDALVSYPGSLILISHDRALLDAVGSRTVAFEEGTLRSYVGGWAEYVRVRAEREAEQQARAAGAGTKQGGSANAKPGARREAKSDSKQSAKSGSASKPKPKSKQANGRAGDMSKLERQIEAAEEALKVVEDELADPQIWSTPDRSAEASDRHTAAKRKVDELYARYEALVG